MNLEHLTRQADLIPMSVLVEKITIIGAGAVGSWTCLALAKMGFTNLTVFDFDRVDIVNLNSQFYPVGAVGQMKVLALRNMILQFTGVEISVSDNAYAGGAVNGIVIAAVDSMKVRRLIWEQHKNLAFQTRAIIDPRMGAESALLYVMNPSEPSDQEAYEKTLYGDSEALQEPCTAKATIYTANLLAGLVCKAVKDLLTRPDYLRVAQWDIAGNDLFCFKKKVELPHDTL